MSISIIAAIGREREIGVNGRLPWQLPEDLKRFQDVTAGHVVIMGRKTYESIGKPLAKRLNIILTRNKDFVAPQESLIAKSLSEALGLVPLGKEAFIIGGARVFEEALKIADRLHLTIVDVAVPNADAFFPKWKVEDWRVARVLPSSPSQENLPNSTYVVYERRK